MIILGDRVVSVNGEFIAGKSYAEVVQLIQSSKDHLQLSVVPQQDDILQMVSIEEGFRRTEKHNLIHDCFKDIETCE